MKKRQRILRPKVLFNASVILAGLHSPAGGSAKVITYAKQDKLEGIVSEIIVDEVLAHLGKLGLSRRKILVTFAKNFTVLSAPSQKSVSKYYPKIIDVGDAHVLASCQESKAKYLITLDKKHLLVLKGKVRGLKIVTPRELIKIFSKN